MAGKTNNRLPNNHQKRGGVAQSSVQLDLCTTLKRKKSNEHGRRDYRRHQSDGLIPIGTIVRLLPSKQLCTEHKDE